MRKIQLFFQESSKDGKYAGYEGLVFSNLTDDYLKYSELHIHRRNYQQFVNEQLPFLEEEMKHGVKTPF